jgi:hypothetical protein
MSAIRTEVDDPRIGAGAADDQLGPDLLGLPLERVIVDPLVVAADTVPVDLEVATAEVERHPMGQMTALIELHPEDPIAGADRAQIRGHVGLGARVALDVDVLRPREQLERTLLGEPLGDVNELAPAVVALAGQALGVLVRQPAALGLEHGRIDVVLAGDELDLVVLPAALADHRRPQLGVDSGDRGPGESRGSGGGHRRSLGLRRSVGRRPVGRRRVGARVMPGARRRPGLMVPQRAVPARPA